MNSPSRPRKGRGAVSNPEGRFESRRMEAAAADGWMMDTDEELPPLNTTVTAEHAKSIISRNDSPDIPFEQSINPYRGCEHGCVYCLVGDTQVLMADQRTKQLGDLNIGDEIVGTTRRGWYRRYVKTRVLAHWRTYKPAYRVMLADGTAITASADHLFLTERGWKFVTRAEQGCNLRPQLTIGTRLMGIGMSAAKLEPKSQYRQGYPCGIVRGDGPMGVHGYQGCTGDARTSRQLRLATVDCEALQHSGSYLAHFGTQTRAHFFKSATATAKEMHALSADSQGECRAIESLIAFHGVAPTKWMKGFLGGIFDAEGSYGEGLVLDGAGEHRRFFHVVDPAIARKRDLRAQTVESGTALSILAIEPLGKSLPMYDITTGTGDFIANGVVSHNCYARPAHSYVNLSPGLDFETKLFYKVNAARLLEEELRGPRYVCKAITLGANTDPYQPIERELKVTRSILEVLHRFRHPVTIVTKGHLIERDLDILSEMARDKLAAVHVSVTTLDSNLKRILEPRAPSASARLNAIRGLHSAGIPVGTLVAPIIPAVNDHEIELILAAAAQAGARSAAYVMLRLPYEVKNLFREWLAEHFPLRAAHVMSLVNDLRGGRDNDPNFGSRMRGRGPFAELVRRRFELACRRVNLNTLRHEPLDTGLFRPPPLPGSQLDLGL